MTINCGKCGRRLREGQEVRATCLAYDHELKSKVVFSVSRPHNIEADSLEHADCMEVDA